MATVQTKRIGSTVVITLPTIPLFMRDQAQAVLTAQARTYFTLALQVLAGHVSDAAPVGVSGHLGQSFGADPVVGQSIEDLTGRLFSDLPYALVIDQGRTPGAKMPPSEALIPWVRKVLGAGGTPAEIQSLAFVIARSIGRKGIVARHFVDKAIAAAKGDLDALFASMGAAMAAALTGNGVAPGAGGVGI